MNSPEIKNKRVTFKKFKGNQNIRTVLKDLYLQLVEKDQKTSKTIEQALISLSKFPLELTSGQDCFLLQGFDRNLCRIVDEKVFHNNDAASLSDVPESNSKRIISIKTLEQINSKSSNKVAVRHESWKNEVDNNILSYEKNFNHKIDAVVIALSRQKLEFPDRPALNLKELISKVQIHFDETITDWRFVQILEHKQKYIKSELQNDIPYYSLTNFGETLVSNHVAGEKVIKSNSHSREKDEAAKRVPLYNNYPQLAPPKSLNALNKMQNEYPLFIDMPPGSYDIVMLIDKNEPAILGQESKNIKCEMRTLKVGDVLWLARSKTNSQELVLPYILERKRMDDFAASIKDGRFHEQKFRLRKCGLKNVIYLIEDCQYNKHGGLPVASLSQAKVNTRVQDGFLVQHTRSIGDTKKFLNLMTLRLISELEGVHLRGSNTDSGGRELMTFEYFNASSSKTKPLTIKDLFIKMLLQLKGVSVEKALAITNVYNSPAALMEAYDQCEPREAELLLSTLKYNSMTPQVSAAISTIIYMLFKNRVKVRAR